MKPSDLYTVSIAYDWRLYKQDIAGSMAHVKMLGKQNIISMEDVQTICMGLSKIETEIENGKFPWHENLEDIHMNIEDRLHTLIGSVAGKLHTARSRNDQVALDMRMYTKEMVHKVIGKISSAQKALVTQAELHSEVILPGYTHLQRAQPVVLAHHLLAYFEMFQRDIVRFQECYNSADVMPLGSGALAGVPYNIDRDHVASELGFNQISSNSMDAVSDRDFLIQYHAAAAICMMHISRLSEELVLWSSQEFGFVTMAPEFRTGSSIMPQKQNPDFAEIARGKTGRVYGYLMSILTTLKGLPLTYNRDLQEDKEVFFNTIDSLFSTIDVTTSMIDSLKFNSSKMTESANSGNMLATDLADYLVSKGLPFREAHQILGKISTYAETKQKEVHSLTLKEYRQFSDLFEQDVSEISLESSVMARNVIGGTSPKRVAKALVTAKKILESRYGYENF